jgi:uncharacterized protein YndB with AHSA1/START domain
MKWLIRIVLGLLGLVVVFLAVGLLLPSQFKVERTATIAAPPEQVYALIADPREWKRWSVWNQRDPAMKITYGGPSSGLGARWSWESQSEGNGSMEFTEGTLPERITYKLTFADFGMTSTGRLMLSPADAGGKPGTRISWTNEGDMGSNPVNRWFGVFMDKLVGPDFEAGLANLKKLAESS